MYITFSIVFNGYAVLTVVLFRYFSVLVPCGRLIKTVSLSLDASKYIESYAYWPMVGLYSARVAYTVHQGASDRHWYNIIVSILKVRCRYCYATDL